MALDKTLVGTGLAGTVLGGVLMLAAQFIEPHEGRINRAYRDPVGVLTACVGNTTAAVEGAVYSDEECDLLLLADLIPVVIAVGKLVERPPSDEEWVAMASLAFNVGIRAFSTSTLLRRFNAGDAEGAAAEFGRWTKAGGRELPGLVVRRAREARLFVSGAPA